MLKKQNRIYKKYKNNGVREVDKLSFDLYRNEYAETIEKSKQNYLSKLGTKLADNCTSHNTCWEIVNNLLM